MYCVARQIFLDTFPAAYLTNSRFTDSALKSLGRLGGVHQAPYIEHFVLVLGFNFWGWSPCRLRITFETTFVTKHL